MRRYLDYSEEFKNAKKRIIYGFDKWAKYAFYTTINDGIRIDGFLIDDNLSEYTHILGIKVYDRQTVLDSLDKETKVFDIFGHNISKLNRSGIDAAPLLTLKSDTSRNAVIYGAGRYGQFALELFRNINVNTICFCDKNPHKQNTIINGVNVISPEKLLEIRNDVDVIICVDPSDAEKVSASIDNRIGDDCWYQFVRNEICLGDQKGIEMLGLSYLQRKSPLLCMIGEKNEIITISRQLGCLDIVFSFAIDVKGFVGNYGGVEFKDKYEIAFDEEMRDYTFIGLHNDNYSALEVAKELDIDQRMAELSRYKFEKKYMWDPNIGYAKTSPFSVYQTMSGNGIRIAILGGSTSDENFSAEKTWVVYFAELLKRDGINADIYNGAVCGYASAQELMRLCRDVILIKPDIVISYSGINDSNRQLMRSNRFVNQYQRDVFSIISNSIKIDKDRRVMEDVYYGVENSDPVKAWSNHERMMHSICEEFDITFVGIAQPSLYSSLGENKTHNISAQNLAQILNDDEPVQKRSCLDSIYAEVRRINEEWLVDFSDVFELCDLFPYMDSSHLYCEGNEYLAGCIFSLIKPKLERCIK